MSTLFRNPEFQLFQSPYQHPDLIFSDACTQFAKVDVDVESYMGADAVEIVRKTDPRMCNSAEQSRAAKSLLLLLTIATAGFYLF